MPVDKSQSSGSGSGSSNNNASRRVLQPACDACHVRRVKCSHEQPCAHCHRLGLTCTYTKAQTAKKTAGKRIEALRQAEKTRQMYEGYDGKQAHAWGPPLPPVGGLSTSGWSGGGGASSSGSGKMYGPGHQGYPLAGGLSDSRYPSSHGSDDRHNVHPFYTNSAGGSTSSPPIGSTAASSWTSNSSQRGRHSQPYESDRQVRFHPAHSTQPPMSSHRSSHYGSPDSATPGSSSNHLAPILDFNGPGSRSGSFGQGSGGPTPFGASHVVSDASQYRGGDVPPEMAYLPSPAHFFAGSTVRPFMDQSAGEGSSAGATAGNGGGVDVSTSTSGIPMDSAVPAAINYLQGSILPPFSTSIADSLFNEQGIFNPDTLFDDSNMPPLGSVGNGQQTVLDMLGTCLPSGETPGSVDSSSMGALDSIASLSADPLTSSRAGANAEKGRVDDDHINEDNHPLSDSILIPTLALFYERLGGVLPVFSRGWIFTKLDRDEHHNNAHFASLLIAMSALTMIQIQPSTDSREKKSDRALSRRRRAKAHRLLEEALRMREGPLMGQTASLEMCCTSFFIFATLFGMGEHSAAWYRLRESITLAHLCRLHEPAAYEGLAKDEAERRLRAYWLLAITERAFAIQRGMPIVLTGNPRASTASLRAKLGFKELSDFPDLQLRLFDYVDEKFVDCWNRKCQGPGCVNFDAERAIALWRSFTDGINQPGSRERSLTGEANNDDDHTGEGHPINAHTRTSSSLPSTPVHRRQIQRADVEVTRHWLLNRLWLITLNHGLLTIDAKDPPLRVDHAIHVAQSVFAECESLSLSAMEAHGVGFTYKLYDIAQTLVLLCKDESIAEAISKGGVGEQLEKHTTAVHTSGRGSVDSQQQRPLKKAKTEQDRGANEDGRSSSVAYRSSEPSSASTASYDGVQFTSLFNASGGPASLRRTVLGILNEFLTLFQRFRAGDHPYLEKLIELINELKADLDPGRPHSSSISSTVGQRPVNGGHEEGHGGVAMGDSVDSSVSHRGSIDQA